MTFAHDVRGSVSALRDAVPQRAGIAVRTMTCVALPLAIGVAFGRPQSGAAASFGGLAGLYVPQSPYRYRAKVVAAVGAGLALAVFIGALAGRWAVLDAAAAGVVAAVASFVCQAAELPPPRELMLIMALLASTAVPAGLAGAAQRAGLAAAGAALAWLVTMAPAASRRQRRLPERRAVEGGLAAVAALVDAIGTGQAARARHAAVESVRRARTSVAQGGVPAADPLARAVTAAEVLLEAVLHLEVEASGTLPPDWGAAIRALIPAVTGGAVLATPLPCAPGPGESQLRRAVDDARADLIGDRPAVAQRAALNAWPGLGAQVGAALGTHSVVVPSAARVGMAVALGVAAGRALGLGHAYWTALTAAAVLQGSNVVIIRRRVIHRLAGTVTGVGLAFAILGWHPSIWLVVAAVALFQGLVEVVIATNYAVAVAGITVLALLLFDVASSGEEAIRVTIGARLVDTVIGAVLGLVLRHLLWPKAALRRLPSAQALTLRAANRVLTEAWAPEPDAQVLADQRRALQGRLAALRAVHVDAVADAGQASGSTDAAWPVSVRIEELARLALSWPAYRPRPAAAEAAQLQRHLEKLASAITGARLPVTAVPALPGQPLTAAAAAALTAAVADAKRAAASG